MLRMLRDLVEARLICSVVSQQHIVLLLYSLQDLIGISEAAFLKCGSGVSNKIMRSSSNAILRMVNCNYHHIFRILEFTTYTDYSINSCRMPWIL